MQIATGCSTRMTPAMVEVAHILAAGVLRAKRREALRQYPGAFSETGLDSSPKRSVHSITASAGGEKR